MTLSLDALACTWDYDAFIASGKYAKEEIDKFLPLVYAEASDVFVGRVVHVSSDGKDEIYKISVLEYIKGKKESELVELRDVYSDKASQSDGCEPTPAKGPEDLYQKFVFGKGFLYLFYAKNNEVLRVNLFKEWGRDITPEEEIELIRSYR